MIDHINMPGEFTDQMAIYAASKPGRVAPASHRLNNIAKVNNQSKRLAIPKDLWRIKHGKEG